MNIEYRYCCYSSHTKAREDIKEFIGNEPISYEEGIIYKGYKYIIYIYSLSGYEEFDGDWNRDTFCLIANNGSFPLWDSSKGCNPLAVMITGLHLPEMRQDVTELIRTNLTMGAWNRGEIEINSYEDLLIWESKFKQTKIDFSLDEPHKVYLCSFDLSKKYTTVGVLDLKNPFWGLVWKSWKTQQEFLWSSFLERIPKELLDPLRVELDLKENYG